MLAITKESLTKAITEIEHEWVAVVDKTKAAIEHDAKPFEERVSSHVENLWDKLTKHQPAQPTTK